LRDSLPDAGRIKCIAKTHPLEIPASVIQAEFASNTRRFPVEAPGQFKRTSQFIFDLCPHAAADHLFNPDLVFIFSGKATVTGGDVAVCDPMHRLDRLSGL
jgi:hypothetical protein